MPTKNIAIIGVGNIGRRHLQSVATLPHEQYNIFAVEPFDETRVQLSKEFEQNNNITIIEDIGALPGNIDLAIIATSSNVRRSVFQELINHSQVKNIIFEKVLFQKVEDYYYTKERLCSLNINAWVDCAMREIDIYKQLKDETLNCKEFVFFTTVGGQWGMGCNSIHILDLIEFLSGSSIDSLDISKLDNQVIQSKRKGFYEFFGTITGRAGKCKHFSITCISNSNLSSIHEIITEKARYRINETENKIFIEKQGKEAYIKEFKPSYVSQITSRIAAEIFEKGTCNLPNYEASMETHLKFITPLFDFFEKQGLRGEKKICPIT